MSTKNNGQLLVKVGRARIVPETELIAHEYRLAASSMAAGLRHYHRCGQLLNEQKARLKHGEWLPWLKRNEKQLGFGQAAAYQMTGFASRYVNLQSTVNLTDQKALTLSRELWGNKPKSKKRKTSKSSASSKKNRSTIAPIASEEGAPLSQHGIKIWDRERHDKMTKRIEKRFADAKLFHQAVRCVNQLDWNKHDGQLAQMAYDQGYRDGASDMEKGLL